MTNHKHLNEALRAIPRKWAHGGTVRRVEEAKTIRPGVVRLRTSKVLRLCELTLYVEWHWGSNGLGYHVPLIRLTDRGWLADRLWHNRGDDPRHPRPGVETEVIEDITDPQEFVKKFNTLATRIARKYRDDLVEFKT